VAMTMAITVDTPTRPGRPLTLDAAAPGRLRATLPDDGPGLYTFVVTTARGTQRQLHLRHQRAEGDAWGTHPALATWRAEGLVGAWDPRALFAEPADERAQRAPDRTLIGLALWLFLAGVVVDRTSLKLAETRAVLKRWWTRPR